MRFELKYSELQGIYLYAPISYWETSEEKVDEITGGCGPGGRGDALVPDSINGISIFVACRIHDWCYSIGRNEQDKNDADNYFLMNMLRIIDSIEKQEEKETEDDGFFEDLWNNIESFFDPFVDFSSHTIAFSYYLAVAYGGNSAFYK